MNSLLKNSIYVLVFSLLFISCKDDNITKPEKTEIQLSKIGYYHNQALDLVLNDKDIDIRNLSYFEFREVITKKLIAKYPEKFSRKRLEVNKSTINAGLIKSSFLKFETFPTKSVNLSSTNPEFTGDFKSIIKHLHENNKIGKTLSSRLLELYGNKTMWASKENPVAYAKKKISKESIPEQDKKYAIAFLSVLEASDKYWSNKANAKRVPVDLMKKECEGGKEQALEETASDAAGALYGMLGGPVWSVVEGALFTGAAILNDGTC